MASCEKCDLCDRPGTVAKAEDVARVGCNVRRFRDHEFTLWRCTGCNSLHCLEDADLGFYYADYPLKKQRLSYSERLGYRNRLRLLSRQGLRSSDRILDYGCGAGLFVEFLRKRGFAQMSGYDAFVPSYSDPAILANEYDAVVSYDVVEHADDTRDFMNGLSRLVRPGGLLAIGTPNADHISLARKADPSLHVPYHRHILSEAALLNLGAEQGLEPIHIYRRSFYDCLVPTVNSRFMWQYIARTGGMLDAAVEPPNPSVVWRSPTMMFFAFFGYFIPVGDNMLITFRRR